MVHECGDPPPAPRRARYKPLPEAPEPEKPGQVLDLMAALTESVQKAKASRGKDADVHEMPKSKKAAAKKATKKTAAKRTSARKPRRSA
ncbi:hypothetical protein ACIRPU_40845 [Streptomyces sp. NPDC102259]|uniref:hypothetical protein n=1 Tax=Streptomyces sp. NPDC102259 TaxID=3366148 RepID=UPI0038092078